MAIEVKMPRLSDTMEVGTVVKWSVKPGQKVKSGDVIADIETDKATMELQTFDDGTVAELSVAEGTSVKVGTIIMRLAEAGESLDAATSSASTASSSVAAAPMAKERIAVGAASASVATSSTANGHAHTTIATPTSTDRIFASPLARKIAGESGVDLGALHGTGPSGRIIRKDVEAALGGAVSGGSALRANPPGQTSRSGSESRPTTTKISDLSAGAVPGVALPPAGSTLRRRTITLSNMRATIAKRLVQSKATIPHYQVTIAVRMDALLNLRQQLNEQLASQGVKLSVNDFLVRACSLAMHQHPHVNARWSEGSSPVSSSGPAISGPAISGPAIELLSDVNIGIAIALPLDANGNGGGLVVATLRNTDRVGLRMISAESKRLSEKARAKGLAIDEMSDSTFTISNLGMFGVEHFTAIINPPNAAILAVGAAIEQPVIIADPKTGAKTIGIGSVMQMTLTSDHRIIDGAMAAQYLATVKDLLEKPASLLV